MPILDGDIVLLKSSVLDDVPEGGGMATGLAVVDGVSNTMFPDISELDRTYGRTSLRKVFPAVLTDTVDAYYGAHVIVAQGPADPRVSAELFTTRSWSDVRTSAQNKLESYLALGSESRYVLYSNHLVGQRSIQVHCARSVPTPGIGEVFALVQRDAVSNQQFVRVTRKRPFTGKFYLHKDEGTYTCAGCGEPLFTSDMKFDSHCGWPSFDKEIKGGKIIKNVDKSQGMIRTEIVCAKCGGHLGHIFDDGPTETGERYCVNSLSLEFVPIDKK